MNRVTISIVGREVVRNEGAFSVSRLPYRSIYLEVLTNTRTLFTGYLGRVSIVFAFKLFATLYTSHRGDYTSPRREVPGLMGI